MKLVPDLMIAIGLAGWFVWLWRRDRRELEMYRRQERARMNLGRTDYGATSKVDGGTCHG